MEEKLNYYTQREWDRTVGIGKVPKEYQYPKEPSNKEELVVPAGLEPTTKPL